MDKPNLTLEEALKSGAVPDRIQKHVALDEFDIAPIGPIIVGDAIRQEDLSPYETAIGALHQGDTRLSQQHSGNPDNQDLRENEKSVVRAVDPKTLNPALRSQRGAELPADSEVSEAIRRAQENVSTRKPK